MSLPKIGIVVGSTRPGRKGLTVGEWVHSVASERSDAEFELLDVAAYGLALLDDPTVPGAAQRKYLSPQTRAWGAAVDAHDGFVWVTPEYNHGVPAAMKNAFDVLYPEWNHKAAGIVSYGADGGVRAVEHWRTIMANAHLTAVRGQLSMSTFTDWQGEEFTPGERRPAELGVVLDQVVRLSGALATMRQPA